MKLDSHSEQSFMPGKQMKTHRKHTLEQKRAIRRERRKRLRRAKANAKKKCGSQKIDGTNEAVLYKKMAVGAAKAEGSNKKPGLFSHH